MAKDELQLNVADNTMERTSEDENLRKMWKKDNK